MLTGRQIPRFWRNNLLIRPLHFFSTKKGIIQSPDMQITTHIRKAFFLWATNQFLFSLTQGKKCIWSCVERKMEGKWGTAPLAGADIHWNAMRCIMQTKYTGRFSHWLEAWKWCYCCCCCTFTNSLPVTTLILNNWSDTVLPPQTILLYQQSLNCTIPTKKSDPMPQVKKQTKTRLAMKWDC